MDIIQKIDADCEAINRKWEDPEGLSVIILRLALSNKTLGDLVSMAEYEMDVARAHYEHARESRKLELVKAKMGAGVAESTAKVETDDQLQDALETKRKYGLLRRKRDSLNTIIDATRSRLSLIKGDIRRG